MGARWLARVGLAVAFFVSWLFVAGPDVTWADDGTPVKVMTFNVRYNTDRDGPDRWALRREMAVDLIRRFEGDFVGIQEALPDQYTDLLKMLPEYHMHGRTRLADPNKGEATLVLYRHDRWQLDPDDHGLFWFSDTPKVAGSNTWGNSYPRMVAWGRFIEKKTGRGVYMYNTHFDHVSETGRQKSAAMLAQRIADRRRPEPVLVTGDFNARGSSPVMNTLMGKTPDSPIKLVDTFRMLHPDEKQTRTCHRFRGGTKGSKIDHILALPGVEVRSAEILRDNRDGRYPSDHYPVTAEVTFPVPQKIVFADRFEAKLADGWTWLRGDRANWRITDGGLDIRIEPGLANTVKNALVRSAPDRNKGKYAIEVTVTFLNPPSNQYEQAGITWYQKGRPIFKLVHERIDGKTYIIPGKVPAPEKTVRLRLLVDAGTFTAQFRPEGKTEYQTVATGPLAAGPEEQISLQCYNGPAKAKHWARFRDFRILAP